MARKKESRVQFMSIRKPLDLRLKARAKEGLNLDPKNLKGQVGLVLQEGDFWASALPTPITVPKAKFRVGITATLFLLWR